VSAPDLSAGLSSSVVLITGAAAGIGAATAAALADRGATVVLVDRSPDVVAAAAAVGGEPVVADLADVGQLGSIVDGVIERHGRLDVLVNNAGVGRHNPITDLRLADIELMWAVNVRAAILLTQAAFKAMTNGGQVVNVVSTAGLQGGPGESVYNATKFALRGFSQAAAEEGRLCGVRVHALFPAGVATSFWDSATEAGPGVDVAKAFLSPADVAASIVQILELSPHATMPEVVLRAAGDADLDAIRRKLDWFHQ
jgi:short-subunit dehydrogenase